MTRDSLLTAGFQRQLCRDGWFWVLERGPGCEAERVFSLCAQCMGKRAVGQVQQELVLQCKADYTGPMLYCDAKLWKLTNQQFQKIVSALSAQSLAKRQCRMAGYRQQST